MIDKVRERTIMEYSSKVTSKGQATIPKEIRKLLNLEKDDKVTFTVRDDGRIIIQRKLAEDEIEERDN